MEDFSIYPPYLLSLWNGTTAAQSAKAYILTTEFTNKPSSPCRRKYMLSTHDAIAIAMEIGPTLNYYFICFLDVELLFLLPTT